MTASEIAARGRELYETTLKTTIEPGNHGKYLTIDVDSGDYEIGDDYLFLARRLRARRPRAVPYTLRIGYPALGRIGGRVRSACA